MVGVGGQGIVLSSNILAAAAMNQGFDVKKSEIHGMSQRGGSVFSHIRYGKKVYSPVIPRRSADIILSLEQMEVLRWADYASEDCQIIYFNEKLLPAGITHYPLGVEDEIKRLFKNVCEVKPEDLKSKLDNVKSVNVALLGVLAGFIDIADSAWEKAINDFVPKGTADVNVKAFKAGRELIHKG